jgi:hypothetical protein
MFEGTMLPFIELFPEQGKNECRTAHVSHHEKLPPGEYGFVELYCADLDCDCRRAVINVFGGRPPKHLATINYGFDQNQKMSGPFLDPINPQSQYSGALLDMFKWILQDSSYRTRLVRHYQQFKSALRQNCTPIKSTRKD